LSIISFYGSLHLKIKGVNKKPTLFKFTKQTATSFVCKNPKNEFSKKIKYYLEKEQLKTIASANNFRIDLTFKKAKCFLSFRTRHKVKNIYL
jgi:hypothetical protein